MANKKIPLRKCVACNEMKEKKEMIKKQELCLKKPVSWEVVMDVICMQAIILKEKG